MKKALPLKDITFKWYINNRSPPLTGNTQYNRERTTRKVHGNGKIALQNVLFKNADFPAGISVPSGEVTITPARLNLKDLKVKINSSDFALVGYLANYLPYVFKDQTLKGNFTLNSNKIDLNEFMANMTTSEADTMQAATHKVRPRQKKHQVYWLFRKTSNWPSARTSKKFCSIAS